MNLKAILKVVSYILIISTLLTFFGCGIRSTSNSSPSGLLSEELNADKMPDDVEDNINNNTGKILFSSPQKTTLKVYESSLYFGGICNTNYPLYMNGSEQSVGKDGYFTLKCDLQLGKNKITFLNGEYEKVFTIIYSQPLIKSYTPSDSKLTLDGGSPLSVTAVAKSEATVKASYNGKTVTLTADDQTAVYSTYKGIVTTAKSGSSTIKITATKGTDTQTVTASKIVISGESLISYSPSAVKSLQNKGYVDVGNKYVAQVVATTAEGFLGGTVDDYSRPTVNYLPKGTVDYCTGSKIYDSESGKKYYLLRNNVRVYSKKSNVKVYKAQLPAENNVEYTGGEISNKHLLMNFKVDWKAPFRFVLGEQGYRSEKGQDYSISSPTYSYVDITFCYSASLENFQLPENPIFKGYKIIKNSKDYTLRLYLKTTGNFWGWKANYTKSGELQFSFLCPSEIQKADNKYGYSLKGIKITIDAGHGGKDSGTYNAANTAYYEKDYNLLYAKTLANELLRLGATVYMPRTEDKTVSLAKRYDFITATNCDLAISVHFNGSSNGSATGYFTSYFNPYTYDVAKSISKSIASTGLISAENGGLDWHYFNLSRVSSCPVVLTENGYLTGVSDYKKIKTSQFRIAYIEGMVQGIVNYFAENSGYAVSYQTNTPGVNSAVTSKTENQAVLGASRVQSTTGNTPQRPITIVSSTASKVVASKSSSTPQVSSVESVNSVSSKNTSSRIEPQNSSANSINSSHDSSTSSTNSSSLTGGTSANPSGTVE